jgi:aconitate hydratase
MVIAPAPEGTDVEVVRGPNIKPFPINKELSDKY